MKTVYLTNNHIFLTIAKLLKTCFLMVTLKMKKKREKKKEEKQAVHCCFFIRSMMFTLQKGIYLKTRKKERFSLHFSKIVFLTIQTCHFQEKQISFLANKSHQSDKIHHRIPHGGIEESKSSHCTRFTSLQQRINSAGGFTLHENKEIDIEANIRSIRCKHLL